RCCASCRAATPRPSSPSTAASAPACACRSRPSRGRPRPHDGPSELHRSRGGARLYSVRSASRAAPAPFGSPGMTVRDEIRTAPAASAKPQKPTTLRDEVERRARVKSAESAPPWKNDWTTVSGWAVPELVTPEQVATLDPVDDIGLPGEYPY